MLKFFVILFALSVCFFVAGTMANIYVIKDKIEILENRIELLEKKTENACLECWSYKKDKDK